MLMCMSCSVCSHCTVEYTVGFLEPGECVVWRGREGRRGKGVPECVLQLCAEWVSGVGSNKLAI